MPQPRSSLQRRNVSRFRHRWSIPRGQKNPVAALSHQDFRCPKIFDTVANARWAPFARADAPDGHLELVLAHAELESHGLRHLQIHVEPDRDARFYVDLRECHGDLVHGSHAGLRVKRPETWIQPSSKIEAFAQSNATSADHHMAVSNAQIISL